MEIIKLKDFITEKGYTVEEWNATVDELCKNGIAKGCFQDYALLSLVIEWLTKLDREIIK